MKVVAYLYSNPLVDQLPDAAVWGWEVEQVYQDVGDRSQLQQLLLDCRSGEIAYLLVQRLEELGDSGEQVSDRLAQFQTAGVTVLATESETYLQTLQQLQAIQRQQRSRHIRQGHARNRLKALPPPGKAPFGYRRGKDRYALDRSTAPMVKDFFEHFLLYGSLRGAVRYLEKKHGKKISVTTGRQWLTNPAYRGDLEYQDGQVVLNTHGAIVSREEAAQVDRLLRRNRRLPPRTASAPRSLAGLVICQTCQAPLSVCKVTARRSDREYLYLRPTACLQKPKCNSLRYEEVLERVIERICEDLPRAVSQTPLPDMEAVKAQIERAIASKQTVLNQLPDLITQGILDDETAALRTFKLRTEIAELQTKITQLPPPNLKAIAQTVSLPQFWLDLSETERRFYFREFLRHIQLIREETTWYVELVFIF